ncbi:MAG: restriction endonuclease subunit S [Methylococcales bacterium]
MSGDSANGSVPPNWRSGVLGDAITLEYGKNLPAGKRSGSGEYPVYGSNGIVGTHDSFLTKEPAIIAGRKGSAGALNIANGPSWTTDVAYFVRPPSDLDLRFTYYLLSSLQLDELGKGIKPGLSRKEAYVLPIALPPLAEQRRIVAKVDQLMALVDQLETQLTAARATSGALLNAAIHELLNPNAGIVEFPSAMRESLSDRATIGCYAIRQMAGKRYFDRTTEMKLLYLAETHLGLNLGGNFLREAAGPFDPWIYRFEEQGVCEGWFEVVESAIAGGRRKIEYRSGYGLDAKALQVSSVLTRDQRNEFDRVLRLFADRTTEQAEVIATLFAAWNDCLLDGHTPDDDEIIHEVRENWHAKKKRFTTAQLIDWLDWLDWLRRNGLVPKGRLPRTAHQV